MYIHFSLAADDIAVTVGPPTTKKDKTHPNNFTPRAGCGEPQGPPPPPPPPFLPDPPRGPTPPWLPPKQTRTPSPPPLRPPVSPRRWPAVLLAARSYLAASTWGRGTSTPSRHRGPPSSSDRRSPARSGGPFSSRTWPRYVDTGGLLGPAPLHRTPVLSRRVSLRTPTASRGGPGALTLDVVVRMV